MKAAPEVGDYVFRHVRPEHHLLILKRDFTIVRVSPDLASGRFYCRLAEGHLSKEETNPDRWDCDVRFSLGVEGFVSEDGEFTVTNEKVLA
ncbi:MAG: hypothetical protein WC640_00830 [Candidatus Paceibacterota bacterium]|jgi:hypothetical protein